MIFVVPRLELVNQTYEKFHQAGIDDVGIIQAWNPLTDSSRPIQIASVQTLQNRNIPPADLVFIDEAHILRSFYADWFTSPEWSAVPFVGLSATPWTKGLGKLYQELIIASTTQDLIDQGHLSNFRVFAPSHPDLSGVHTVAGDYHEGELGMRWTSNRSLPTSWQLGSSSPVVGRLCALRSIAFMPNISRLSFSKPVCVPVTSIVSPRTRPAGRSAGSSPAGNTRWFATSMC